MTQLACARWRWNRAGLLTIAVALGAGWVSFAVAAPLGTDPATTLQRSQSQLDQLDRATAPPKQTGPAVVTSPISRKELPAPGGPLVLLKTVSFGPPSEFLTTAQLDAIAAKYIGRRVDFSQISALVREVNDLYAAKGIVTASAILPPQKLTDGNLKVQLVEGKLGNVAVAGAHLTSDKFVLASVKLARNGVVDVPRAGRDIEFFNKTNSAQLRLLLQPGASFGLTDLSLGITEPPRNTLQFFSDNQGSLSTGLLEYGMYFRGYDLMGNDDSLTFYGTDSAGSLSGTLSYNTPITPFGTRVAGSLTRSGIRVVDGPTLPLDITGSSQAATVTLSQQLIGTANWSAMALISGAYVTSASQSGITPLVDSVTKKAVLGFSLAYTSENASFSIQPQLIYANAHDQLIDGYTDVLLAAGSASGTVKLPADMSIAVNGAWQVSNTQLLPGDLLFQIGGGSTVRGFQSGAVAGDSGYYAQIELHRDMSALLEGLDVFAFADMGEVFSTFPAQTYLTSAGAGLSMNIKGGATAQVTAGMPILKALSDQPAAAIYFSVRAKAF
ncbi:MAG: ShlB/FhaC/HecB family hemolysin secretion/activation protein [Hyphomicrobiales bacterium]|nr:ShlB/FhaC/HecB family hemolysin secretion/activation protein [Hyphomicrobiales bacterium]